MISAVSGMERRASQIAQMAAQRRASMASRQEAGMGGGGDGKISLVAPVITRKGESTDLLQAETKVLNFSTIRWLEKHHNHRVVKRAELDEGKVRQLREMFDHMDMDGSGDIEVDEVEQAMKFVRALNPQHPFDREKILQTFEYTDSDGSGTLSFDEFLTVMTSDDVGHTFFRLSDEQRADGDEKSFFQFATLYRREMLLNSITGGSKNMQRRPARNSNLQPDSNVSRVHQTLRLCFENSMRAIDSSKNQPIDFDVTERENFKVRSGRPSSSG